MKVFLVLALAVVVRGTVIRYAPAVAVAETGDSAQFRSEDNLGNYNFGYNEDHTSGGSFRREAGDAYGNVAGSYGLRDADGRLRIVNYVADDAGFRADIKTNEPGVEPKDPADVAINKGAAIVVESAAPAAIVAPAPLATFAVEQAPLVAAPVAKTISTTTFTAQEPIAVKSAHVFPAPVAAPVAKTSATTVEVAHAPAVFASAPVAAFPAPLAAPVAKTSTTTVEVAHAPAPIAIAQPAPVAIRRTYEFPPAVPAPVAKTATVAAVAQAPVSITYARPAPVAFPPAPVAPVAKSIPVAAVASAPAPLTYTSHVAIPTAEQEPLIHEAPARYAAVDVGAPALTYSSPLAFSAPVAPLSFPSGYAINHLTLGSPAHYGHSYYAPRALAVKSSGIHYAGAHSPLYYGHPSPALSIMGASTYLNPYHFNGVSYVKK